MHTHIEAAFFALLALTLFMVASPDAYADCASDRTHHGLAMVEIGAMHAQKGTTRSTPKHIAIDFAILGSQDVLLTGRRGPNGVSFPKSPYYKGKHERVSLRCDQGICDALARVDFKKKVVRALLTLRVSCPDTFYGPQRQPRGVVATMMRAAGAPGSTRKSVALMQVLPR